MAEILISAAEPLALAKLLGAKIDGDVETVWHSDIIWQTPYGMALVQRKRFPSDLISSHRGDDRLAEWIRAAQDGKWAYLIIEIDPELNGRVPWSTDGQLVGRFQGRGGISRKELDSITESLAFFRGIQTRWTSGITETAELIKRLFAWTTKPDHTGYQVKRKACEKSTEDLREWVLQSFHGIGPTLAKKILKECPEPILWNPELKLENVKNLGPKTIKLMKESLKPR